MPTFNNNDKNKTNFTNSKFSTHISELRKINSHKIQSEMIAEPKSNDKFEQYISPKPNKKALETILQPGVLQDSIDKNEIRNKFSISNSPDIRTKNSISIQNKNDKKIINNNISRSLVKGSNFVYKNH